MSGKTAKSNYILFSPRCFFSLFISFMNMNDDEDKKVERDIWSDIDHQKNWWTEQKLESSGEDRDCMRARHPREVEVATRCSFS